MQELEESEIQSTVALKTICFGFEGRKEQQLIKNCPNIQDKILDQEKSWLKLHITFFTTLMNHPEFKSHRAFYSANVLVYALDFVTTKNEDFYNKIGIFLEEHIPNCGSPISSNKMGMDANPVHFSIMDTAESLELPTQEALSKQLADKPTRSKRKKTKNSPY